jgi:hypothetical protein
MLLLLFWNWLKAFRVLECVREDLLSIRRLLDGIFGFLSTEYNNENVSDLSDCYCWRTF